MGGPSQGRSLFLLEGKIPWVYPQPQGSFLVHYLLLQDWDEEIFLVWWPRGPLARFPAHQIHREEGGEMEDEANGATCRCTMRLFSVGIADLGDPSS